MQARALITRPELPQERPGPDYAPDIHPLAGDEGLDDPLSAGRGIAFGIVLALPLWFVVGFAAYALWCWLGL
jgi:hypothetical protein